MRTLTPVPNLRYWASGRATAVEVTSRSLLGVSSVDHPLLHPTAGTARPGSPECPRRVSPRHPSRVVPASSIRTAMSSPGEDMGCRKERAPHEQRQRRVREPCRRAEELPEQCRPNVAASPRSRPRHRSSQPTRRYRLQVKPGNGRSRHRGKGSLLSAGLRRRSDRDDAIGPVESMTFGRRRRCPPPIASEHGRRAFRPPLPEGGCHGNGAVHSHRLGSRPVEA
jgi:hypothetical protein